MDTTTHTNEISLNQLIQWQSKTRQILDAVRSNLVVRAFEQATTLHQELEKEIKAKEAEMQSRRGSQGYQAPGAGPRSYSSGYERYD